jgi:hypothetical protein
MAKCGSTTAFISRKYPNIEFIYGKTPKIALLKHKFADLALCVFEITKMTLFTHIIEFLVSRPPPKIQILSTTRDLFQHRNTYPIAFRFLTSTIEYGP